MTEKAKQLGNETAYPIIEFADSTNTCGVTKREYFAGLAMQGLLSNCVTIVNAEATDEGDFKAISRDAVKFADAMLEELSKD
ncbi:MAG: hypothetical protein LBH91_03140 [Prevotellaceae bacterium]|nr:hypothetical protein [Prevotellaceae bacterium]